MTNPKALNNLSLLMVEALRPLSESERNTILSRLQHEYGVAWMSVKIPKNMAPDTLDFTAVDFCGYCGKQILKGEKLAFDGHKTWHLIPEECNAAKGR